MKKKTNNLGKSIQAELVELTAVRLGQLVWVGKVGNGWNSIQA